FKPRLNAEIPAETSIAPVPPRTSAGERRRAQNIRAENHRKPSAGVVRHKWISVAIGLLVIVVGGFSFWVYLNWNAIQPEDKDTEPTAASAAEIDPSAKQREAAEVKQEQIRAALHAVDAALEQGDTPAALARLEEARAEGVDPAALDERRRRLRDHIETLATAAASEAKKALEKKDVAGARAAIQRSRDFNALAAALESGEP
ncbi:MAG: hypothetical protein ACRERU_04510, partial [Methylococcales bacterium]